MKKYSAYGLVKEAFNSHLGWGKAWRSAQPKKKYKVIIVGAGGHGLATAYYLGKNFGIKDYICRQATTFRPEKLNLYAKKF